MKRPWEASVPVVSLAGVAVAAVATAAYTYEQSSMVIATQGNLGILEFAAALYLAALVAGVVMVLLDLRRVVSRRIATARIQGYAPTSPGWLLPYVLSLKRYWRITVGSAVLYGFFYAFVTSMIVFQPGIDIGRVDGVAVPSAVLTPRGAPLFAPVLTVYLSDHVGVLVIPLTALLLVAISVLVGLNFSMSAFAFASRARGGGRGLVGAIGAVVGLFTGCPTCAGVFFANTLGGSGAATFATLLGYYQPAFILLSVPVLLVTPLLTSRSLARVYRDGCVRFGPEGD